MSNVLGSVQHMQSVELKPDLCNPQLLVVILGVLTEREFRFSLLISQLLAKAIPVRGAILEKPAQGNLSGLFAFQLYLSFRKVRLNALLQIVFGADGRIFRLRPQNFDVFVSLAEKCQAVARTLIFAGQRASDTMEI